MKTKWVKETPTVEGWYWMKYKNKRNEYTVCPAKVTIVGKATLVVSARNDCFIEGPDHGGPGLKYNGVVDKRLRFVVDKSIRFGTAIPEPV